MNPMMNMNSTSDPRPEEAPNCMQNQKTHAKRAGEGGFALILAILALMLLTFLGLTLAATTSTELQIATNYRWSQQALYNAQAGLEVGKLALMSADWTTILPAPRGAATALPSAVAPLSRTDQFGNASRNFEGQNCDAAVGNEGFGAVLDTGTGDASAPYQSVTAFRGQTLNGAFTLWVRRVLIDDGTGKRMDDTDNGNLVMTSEGTAPYTAGGGTLAFTQANRAVRILEMRLTNTPLNECPRPDQEGLNSSGSGFNTCNPLDPTKDSRTFSAAR